MDKERNKVQESVENKQEKMAAKKKNRGLSWLIVAVGVLMLAGFGFAGYHLYSFISQSKTSVTERQQVEDDGNRIITKEEEDIASVSAKVAPSVVSIITTSHSSIYRYGAEEQGAGTGIIVSSDGYVMTNKHVVNGASSVQVLLSDGTSYPDARVIGADPLNDIAFLKIPDVKDLQAAELGDSTSIRVGQRVVAIGNTLGEYQNTVTSGIISGTGRPIAAENGNSVEALTDLIQTDAAINPGNSGGPLLNIKGQVIGVNTAIVEGAQGIGFAIPIGATKGALKGVLKGGPVEHAFLGVNYVQVTAEVKKQYGLSVSKGAYVFNDGSQSAIVSGGPADKAGIKDKDIITKVGEVEVGSRGSVASLVAEYAPGDTIELTILRGDRTLTVKVTLAAYKA